MKQSRKAKTKNFLGALAAASLLNTPAALAQSTCKEPLASDFRKINLDANGAEMDSPVDMGIAADGRVLFLEMYTGNVRLYKPGTPGSAVIGSIPVFNTFEEGALGIELDPDFSRNGWIYVLYNRMVSGSLKIFLSRWTITNDKVDQASEKILLSATRDGSKAHSGGGMAFDAHGNLYVAIGDNTNPQTSPNDGFAAVNTLVLGDDAQRTASNTNDLRGKVLRIHPEANGTYTIPAGNLFPPAPAGSAAGGKTRPEIYTMGHRNPYRISVDKPTGWLFIGEVGPDAHSASAIRGPVGHEELNLAKNAGFFGWPYHLIDQSYFKTDYSTGSQVISNQKYDPLHPQNLSKNNTGLTDLPPAQVPLFWYSYDKIAAFPQIGGGQLSTIMAGPVYRYNPDLNSKAKFPPFYDSKLFFGDWGRQWLKVASLDPQAKLTGINAFIGSNDFIKGLVSLDFGPDGALYVLQWGTGGFDYTNGGALYRIEYTGAYDNSCFQPATSAQGLLPARERASASAWVSGSDLVLPAASRGVVVYGLRGEKIWSYRADGKHGPLRLSLPEGIRKGMLRARYF